MLVSPIYRMLVSLIYRMLVSLILSHTACHHRVLDMSSASCKVCLPCLQDMFTVDEMIPMSFRSWVICLLGVIGTLFVICLATPLFTAVIMPLAVVYYFVQVT